MPAAKEEQQSTAANSKLVKRSKQEKQKSEKKLDTVAHVSTTSTTKLDNNKAVSPPNTKTTKTQGTSAHKNKHVQQQHNDLQAAKSEKKVSTSDKARFQPRSKKAEESRKKSGKRKVKGKSL